MSGRAAVKAGQTPNFAIRQCTQPKQLVLTEAEKVQAMMMKITADSRLDSVQVATRGRIGSLVGACGNACARFLGLSSEHAAVQPLEGRTLMSASIITEIPDRAVLPGASAATISLAGRYDDPALNSTIARFATSEGDIYVLLYDGANPGVARTTPATVANFLSYINAGRYTETVIHRSVAGFVIQGGGFSRPPTDGAAPVAIPTFAAVQNEPGNSNVRGTIAMAKQGGNPNSGTNQWFFNLNDNSGNLDNQNGGFTAFGRVIRGLDVVDRIANIPRFSFGDPFTDLPLKNYADNDVVNTGDFVAMNVTTIAEMTYTVTSSNSTLVAPTLSGTNLNLSYGAGISGIATLTVRATSADGTFVDDVFTVRVNSAPVLAGLNAGFSQNVGRNTPFVLGFSTATDDGGIARIDFFRDTNSNGTLEIGTDALLGADSSAEGGFNFATNTNDFPLGQQRYFAKAVDIDGVESAVVSSDVSIVNAAPVVSAFTASPNPAEGRVPVTLTAAASDNDGAVAFVRFYRDSNQNGNFDAQTDVLLGEDNNGSNGFTTTFETASFTFGNNRYFAVATDGEGQLGTPVSVVGLINSPFSIGSLTAPETILRRERLTIVASEIFTPAGRTLRTLEFYADTNGSGQFEEGVDRRVGSANRLSSGTASVRVSTNSLQAGNNVYFARLQDSAREWSPATSVIVNVLNNAPVVRSLRANPSTVRNLGDAISLNVSGQRDVDGRIAEVRYYRDTATDSAALDGVLDPAVDTLLGTVDRSSGGYRLSVNSDSFVVGVNRFFAVVVDLDGAESAPVIVTNIINAAPVLEQFVVTPEAGERNIAIFNFTASGVGDSDGSVRSVEFYYDTNSDGVLNTRQDRSLGKAKFIDGVWTLDVKGNRIPLGTVTLFARAADNTGAFSSLRTDQVVVS